MLYTRYAGVDGYWGTIGYAIYKVCQSAWVLRNHWLCYIQGTPEWMGTGEPLIMLYTRYTGVDGYGGTIGYAIYKVHRSGWVLGNHWLCYIQGNHHRSLQQVTL